MSNYARVFENSVQEVGLPQSGKLSDGSIVSGFDKLPLDVLNREGWLPLEDNPPVVDSEREELVDEGYDIQADKVVRVWSVVPKAPYLTSDRSNIPPDGTTVAVVAYRNPQPNPPTSVVFVVNGVSSAAANVVNGVATVNVTSKTPDDTILVTTQGLSLTIGVTNG